MRSITFLKSRKNVLLDGQDASRMSNSVVNQVAHRVSAMKNGSSEE